MSETVEAEIRGLAEQYRNEGPVRLVAVIAGRSGPRGNPESIYLLTDPRLTRLAGNLRTWPALRSDEHTSELQSLMPTSYAVLCLKKTKLHNTTSSLHTTLSPPV